MNQQLQYFNTKSEVPPMAKEIGILVTARFFNSDFEWWSSVEISFLLRQNLLDLSFIGTLTNLLHSIPASPKRRVTRSAKMPDLPSRRW